MQGLLGFRWQAPEFFCPWSTVAQLRNQVSGALNHGGIAVRARPRDRTSLRLPAASSHMFPRLPRLFGATQASPVYRLTDNDQGAREA
jgi:adenylyl- and sulfurtransferase ThiI